MLIKYLQKENRILPHSAAGSFAYKAINSGYDTDSVSVGVDFYASPGGKSF